MSRGRPKGSRTREYIAVRELPPKCPKCGSTNLRQIKGARVIVREMSGPDYDRVEWRRKQCECGQLLQVRTFQKINTGDILQNKKATA